MVDDSLRGDMANPRMAIARRSMVVCWVIAAALATTAAFAFRDGGPAGWPFLASVVALVGGFNYLGWSFLETVPRRSTFATAVIGMIFGALSVIAVVAIMWFTVLAPVANTVVAGPPEPSMLAIIA